MRKLFKLWLLPILFSTLVFFGIRPTLAQIAEAQVPLSEFLQAENVLVGDEMGANGFRQIYYIYNANKNYITNTNYANANPVRQGEYIVWMGQVRGGWQIFLHNLISGATTQLSFGENNANPKIDNGRVVWEGWVDSASRRSETNLASDISKQSAGWQVFLFDGVRVSQLTTGDTSLNPYVEGDYLVYARKDIGGEWRSVVYSISRNEAKEVTFGPKSEKPMLLDGKIITGIGSNKVDEFPLTVDDMFVLDLSPLTNAIEEAAWEVSEEEIMQELQESSAPRPD